MAINFPGSPTDGQVFTSDSQSWTYYTTPGVWKVTSGAIGYTGSTGTTFIGDTAPAFPLNGDTWFDSEEGIRYVYYADGTSSQWIQESTVGPMGYPGYIGSAGSIGYTGSQGYTGSASTVIGYTGSQGNPGPIAGSNTQIIFNDSNIANGSSNFTFDKTSNLVSANNINIAGNLGLGTTTPATRLDLNGASVTNVVAVAASDVDCMTGNYFTKTATGALTWTVTNVPANRAYSFLLELTNGGTGTQTWYTGTKWPGGTAPTLTASGVDVLGFITDDGGTNWRGVLLMKDSK